MTYRRCEPQGSTLRRSFTAASPGRDRTDKPATRTRRGGFSDRIRKVFWSVFLTKIMTNDILADAREFIGDRHERLQTHSEECWRWHPACMVGRLAREVDRLRTIMRRVVDEDCTIAVQGGAILADDEVVCRVARAAHEMAGTATACTAEADTTQPRNGAVCTPSTQTTPGECSTHGDGT